MKNLYIWQAEKYVPLLMTYGFTLHIIRVAMYFRDGTANISQIILPLVDLPLAIMMAYCALAMIIAWRQFFKVFEMRSTWRKVIYWIITGYIAGSVPGHIGFLVFGITAYFDFFPWWFSVILLFAYAAIIVYFFTLKPNDNSRRA
ncbi:MAG: hypothetical protein L0287_29450 [Anaerolineae bacterium]|nr:hypothetical protein [Anaerolineae bacterium]